MKQKIAAVALAVYLTGGFGTAYANPNIVKSGEEVVVSIETIEDSAGVLPNSVFYGLERKIEALQIAISKSEEKLAALKAQYATERAAEAVIMINEGEAVLASEASDEYMAMLASATEHINHAIEDKNEAVKTLETLNEAYRRSEQILNTILENAPEDARAGIENALDEQDKAISAINGFYAAKAAFFAAKDKLREAKGELKAAKRSGDPEAIRAAQEKVKTAEASKDELEALKDSAESAKEEVKNLKKQVEKRIKLGMKQIDKVNEKMEKIEEKSFEKVKKSEEKAKKLEEKETEKKIREEEKAREPLRKAEEKARERAKKIEEKAREQAKKTEEKARD